MIRKATIKDISRIAEILIFAKRSAYRNIFHDDASFTEMQVLPLALKYVNNPDLLDNIIVFDDEFVKGMANTELCTSVDGLVAFHITEIYVDTFFQHLGIGKEMLLEIENQCKCNGVSGIFLWVLEKNQQAIRFYEKHGFQPTDERQLVEGTQEYEVKYAKRI